MSGPHPFYAMIETIKKRKEVSQDEKARERQGAGKRGGLLERTEGAGENESRHGMPQMKGLKELALLVSNHTQSGG